MSLRSKFYAVMEERRSTAASSFAGLVGAGVGLAKGEVEVAGQILLGVALAKLVTGYLQVSRQQEPDPNGGVA